MSLEAELEAILDQFKDEIERGYTIMSIAPVYERTIEQIKSAVNKHILSNLRAEFSART